MKVDTDAKRIEHGLLTSMLALAVVFAAGGQPAALAEAEQVNPAATQATSGAATTKEPEVKPAAPAGAVTSRAYKDPVTGEIGVPPAEALSVEIFPEMEEALSTSSEGLEETLGATAGGGTIVDLKGRFRSAMTATKDPDGKISIRCLPNNRAQ